MLENTPTGPIGNYYDKFGSGNWMVKRLMARFKQDYADLFVQASPDRLLEVGCGEGHMLALSWQMRQGMYAGIDLGAVILQQAQQRCPAAHLAVGDGHHLPYPANYFDLVVACEVLEHVQHPALVLQEMSRVSRGYCLVSVPREPIWRALNLMRGKYIKDLGNTPGHIQHWGARGFVAEVGRILDIVEVRYPLPWTMLLCRV